MKLLNVVLLSLLGLATSQEAMQDATPRLPLPQPGLAMHPLVGLTTLVGALATTHAVNVSIATGSPSGAPTLPPDLVSFSIEQDRWTDWAGTKSVNQFTYNAWNNLKLLSGSPPWIRIGADSEDHTNFDPSVEYSELVFPAPTATVPYPEATNITVGDGFYSIVSHLPENTHVIWGLNLRAANLTNDILEMQSIDKAFDQASVKSKNIVLDYIEIGNEADLYVNNGGRNSSFNIKAYVDQWTQFATNVSEVGHISDSSLTKFMACAFAESTHTSTGFSPESAFDNGLLDSKAGSEIGVISQHHYSGSFCAGTGALLQDLMTKSTIRGNVTEFKPDVDASNAKGLPLWFGETNSYSCHGTPGVSNTAGAALWALDYALYSPQGGIGRVFFHEGIGYKYNFIQPVSLNRSILDGSPLPEPLPPHIQPAYYAAIIAAEAIGPSGATTATELQINNTHIAGYAFYESKALKRAVLINSLAYLSTSNDTRPSTNVTLDFTGDGAPQNMQIKRLAIQHADDTSNVTWGGQTYETPDALVSGDMQVENVPVDTPVNIKATEVVMLTFI